MTKDRRSLITLLTLHSRVDECFKYNFVEITSGIFYRCNFSLNINKIMAFLPCN